MKYFAALPFVASLVAAQADMTVMEVMPAAPEGGAATHTVKVGGAVPAATGGAMNPVLLYNPESIEAAVGDVVMFEFYAKNHTATQSTFAEPCKKMEGGADSGFMANPDNSPGVTWEFTVDTEEPIWFYCKQQNGIHCGKGMVFGINAAKTGDKTMAAFKQLAVNTNGTDLEAGAIQSVDPAAAAAPTTVTLVAGGGEAAATPAPAGESAAPAAEAPASVVGGQGMNGQGDACSCSCLCGVNSFPANAAVGNFGGFAGMM